jgi:hypothetical protein
MFLLKNEREIIFNSDLGVNAVEHTKTKAISSLPDKDDMIISIELEEKFLTLHDRDERLFLGIL